MNMSKKKIFYIVTKSNFGGAQRYVYDLATSLPREEYETAVVYGGEGLLGEKLKKAGVRTITIPHLERDIKLGSELKTFWTLMTLFRKERPDIIHLNSSKIGGLGSLAGRVSGVPRIIFTAHGWYFKEDRPWFTRKITLFLSWLTAILSHNVIVVSDDDKRYAPKIAVTKKIERIHNGLLAQNMLKRETARQKIRHYVEDISLSRGAHWVGTISELHKNKGLTYAIEAVARTRAIGKNVLLFIVGDGEDRPLLDELIARKAVQDAVFILGYVNDAPTLLSAFDSFMLTSVKEGLPYALLEAGAAKLPTIGSAVGGIPEIITDMESGILTRPREAKEIADALCFLVDNAPRRQELGVALHAHVTTHFTKDRMLTETLALYQRKN